VVNGSPRPKATVGVRQTGLAGRELAYGDGENRRGNQIGRSHRDANGQGQSGDEQDHEGNNQQADGGGD
jgi:hypothetical protein